MPALQSDKFIALCDPLDLHNIGVNLYEPRPCLLSAQHVVRKHYGDVHTAQVEHPRNDVFETTYRATYSTTYTADGEKHTYDRSSRSAWEHAHSFERMFTSAMIAHWIRDMEERIFESMRFDFSGYYTQPEREVKWAEDVTVSDSRALLPEARKCLPLPTTDEE